MKRIFIISNCNFPRGGAQSNYIQYFIKAFIKIGYSVKLITNMNKEYINNDISYHHSGLEICPVYISKNKIVRHFQNNFQYSLQRINYIRKLKINKDDIVFLFVEDDKYFYDYLLKLREKIGFKIIGAVLEMFDKNDFSGSNPDLRYKKRKFILDEIFTQFNAIIPISTYIEKYYTEKNIKTFLIPIMADIESQLLLNIKKDNKRYKFILPANGKMKDALSEMLLAFSDLTNEELKNVELHLCGVKIEKIKEILDPEQINKIKDSLIVHNWMKYDELISLYREMHYLFLARKTQQMTLANFPSKVPETMCYGIVPIVSDVGDYTKYYLEDGVNSIFINNCTREDCLISIRKAISISDKDYISLSNNAIKCVKTKFDYHVWIPKIQEMLELI